MEVELDIEPVTGFHKSEVVLIDSTGAFTTSFQIAHATSKVVLIIGKVVFSFFAEPNQSYYISISNEEEVSFIGKNSDVNNHFMEL